MPKQFDPHKFIDREFERELFEQLLPCQDQSRILAIKDVGGQGKSFLLQYFQHRCVTVKPRTPVSFIELDQLPDDSPLALVQAIANDLKRFKAPFPTFDKLEAARHAHDFTTIRSAVDLRQADMQGATVDVAGTMTKIQRAEAVTIKADGGSEFTPEQQIYAQEKSVEAFLKDLKDYCNIKPVVIMFDAYEKCVCDLQSWLVQTFLEQHCFDLTDRPAYLLLVIAGRETPNFDAHWPVEDCEAVVQSVRGLSKWNKEDLAEFLQVHGFEYAPAELESFYNLLEIGYTPFEVINIVETRDRRRQQ